MCPCVVPGALGAGNCASRSALRAEPSTSLAWPCGGAEQVLLLPLLVVVAMIACALCSGRRGKLCMGRSCSGCCAGLR
eukprot:2112561-Pyramimonas_sp.AAC.1